MQKFVKHIDKININKEFILLYSVTKMFYYKFIHKMLITFSSKTLFSLGVVYYEIATTHIFTRGY